MSHTREPTRAPTPEELAGLRVAVGTLAAVSGRRPVATVVRVGRPPTLASDFVVGRGLDATLRTDVAAALLGRAARLVPTPMLWLTRSGPLATEDVDLAWYAAARAAWGEAGLPLLMAVVTRSGWYDPSGERRREWRRLRLDR